MDRQCSWCDRGWAAIGIATALAIGAISLDLATGGRITRAIFGEAAASDSGD
jgi:hypothetical protein